jgi:ketosteroid isomerase-like protein
MTTANRKGSHEAKIRELLEGWSSALRGKDTDRVMSHYAAELVQFDLAPPVKYAGANALSRTFLEKWFSSFQGLIWLRNSRPEHHCKR